VKPLVKKMTRLLVAAPQPPWQEVADVAIGGLPYVGFAPLSATLLVVSSQGRRGRHVWEPVADCTLFERVSTDTTR
jgi:hypothetical protein